MGKRKRSLSARVVREDLLKEMTLKLQLEKCGKGQRKYLLGRGNRTCGYLSWYRTLRKRGLQWVKSMMGLQDIKFVYWSGVHHLEPVPFVV